MKRVLLKRRSATFPQQAAIITDTDGTKSSVCSTSLGDGRSAKPLRLAGAFRAAVRIFRYRARRIDHRSREGLACADGAAHVPGRPVAVPGTASDPS
jgi:hypothetical protein